MNKKRALVLSGGGSKGAFQVGVLKYLIGELNNQYDIYTGISVGALNASFLSQFPKGKEKEALENLVNIWNKINKGNIYHNHRPFGKLEALWKSSVYDSSPLKDFVYNNLDPVKVKESGNELRISACSLLTGNLKVWNEKDTDVIRDAVLASSSFPVMFNPIKINDDLFTDAGVKDIAPLSAAIDAGAEIIDIIVTSPFGSQPWKTKRKNSIKVLLRSVDLMSDEILANDLIKLEKINKKVILGTADPRYKYIEYNLYRPENLLTDNSLDFDRKLLDTMMVTGYKTVTEK